MATGHLLAVRVGFFKRLRARLLTDVLITDPGCWTWTKADNGKGYGRIKVLGKLWLTHRLSYRLFVGPIPAGVMILHQCDNPPCLNPSHLFPGSRSDNMKDAARKGRLNTVKLSPAQVLAVLSSGSTVQVLAQELDVTEQTVRDIRAGRTWGDLCLRAGPIQGGQKKKRLP